MKKDNVTTQYKDNVFCMLYRDKTNLLDLYNALNDTSYANIDDLSVTTLPGGVYMKYKNDASFVFGQDLYMFEQQSTQNPNMPLRFLHYVSDVYREMFANAELHRSKLISLPMPHFVTFYNGRESMKESETILKLSDMFKKRTKDEESELVQEIEPELELKVRVININLDNRSSGILNKCPTLLDYMLFVDKVRRKKEYKNIDIRTAVIEAVDECVSEGILEDFFRNHRDEVIEMSIYEYDEEGHMEVLKEENQEKGRLLQKIDLIIKKVKNGKDIDTIANELEEDTKDIKPLYDAVIAAAPDYNAKVIVDEVY